MPGWKECVPLLLLLTASACSGVDAGSEGRVVVRANGGVETRDGIARERFADGYLVRYEHAVLSVSSFHLRTRDGDDAVVATTPTVVDLVPSSAEVLVFDGVASQRWDEVGFQSHAVQPGARNVNAPAELVQRMQERGYSFLQTGTLTAPDGAVIPFELGHAIDIDYFTCTAGDGTYGIVVPVNGTAEAEITWHVTHLWFDSFAEDSAFRAEAIAAVYTGSGPVTMEQLASQPLGKLRDREGKPLRDSGGNPVIYIPPQEPGVNTLRDFAVRARFGHFNGLNGSCETEVRLR
ncbi:MAG TPA: hypothetical protein VFX59_29385 [Polyangiales bacterium]|nr:hypothetical protein [Polyangiales bacterium]